MKGGKEKIEGSDSSEFMWLQYHKETQEDINEANDVLIAHFCSFQIIDIYIGWLEIIKEIFITGDKSKQDF